MYVSHNCNILIQSSFAEFARCCRRHCVLLLFVFVSCRTVTWYAQPLKPGGGVSAQILSESNFRSRDECALAQKFLAPPAAKISGNSD